MWILFDECLDWSPPATQDRYVQILVRLYCQVSSHLMTATRTAPHVDRQLHRRCDRNPRDRGVRTVAVIVGF